MYPHSEEEWAGGEVYSSWKGNLRKIEGRDWEVTTLVTSLDTPTKCKDTDSLVFMVFSSPEHIKWVVT